MSTRKQIEESGWQEKSQSFISGNKGRTSALAAKGVALVEKKPLIGNDNDHVGKGNDFIISLEGFTHTVNALVEVYITEESNGVVSALEVVDQNEKSIFLKFP